MPVLLLVFAVFPVVLGWQFARRPPTAARVDAFLRRHHLAHSTDNEEYVVAYLSHTRRWRTAGVFGGYLVSLAAGLPHERFAVEYLPLLAGWFVGAAVAEFRFRPVRESGRVESGLLVGVRVGDVPTEGGLVESGRAEGGWAEGGRAEGGWAEGGRAEGDRAASGGVSDWRLRVAHVLAVTAVGVTALVLTLGRAGDRFWSVLACGVGALACAAVVAAVHRHVLSRATASPGGSAWAGSSGGSVGSGSVGDNGSSDGGSSDGGSGSGGGGLSGVGRAVAVHGVGVIAAGGSALVAACLARQVATVSDRFFDATGDAIGGIALLLTCGGVIIAWLIAAAPSRATPATTPATSPATPSPATPSPDAPDVDAPNVVAPSPAADAPTADAPAADAPAADAPAADAPAAGVRSPGPVLVAVAVLVAVSLGWVGYARWRDHPPYPAAAVHATATLRFTDERHFAQDAGALGATGLTGLVPQAGRRQFVGRVDYTTPAGAGVGGTYYVFAVDRRQNRVVEQLYDTEGSGWGSLQSGLAARYGWLSATAPVVTDAGFTDRGASVSRDAGAPGPLTFAGSVAGAADTSPADLMVVLVFVGPDQQVYWATRVSG